MGLWIVDWTRDDEPEPLLINNITNCKCLRTLPNGGAPTNTTVGLVQDVLQCVRAAGGVSTPGHGLTTDLRTAIE